MTFLNKLILRFDLEKGMNLTTTRTLRIEMHQLASILYNRDEEDYRVILYFSTYSRPLFAPEYDNSPCSVDVPKYFFLFKFPYFQHFSF